MTLEFYIWQKLKILEMGPFIDHSQRLFYLYCAYYGWKDFLDTFMSCDTYSRTLCMLHIHYVYSWCFKKGRMNSIWRILTIDCSVESKYLLKIQQVNML